MTTPERPSLADTIARIEAVLAEQKPLPPLLPVVGQYLSGLQLDIRTGTPLTMAELAAIERNLNTKPTLWQELIGTTRVDWRPFGHVTPYVKPALVAAARESAAQLAATADRINAKTAAPNPPATEPGGSWLERLRRHLRP